MTLWDFAMAAWERPDVSEACLKLQDCHGQCVVLLLWRAWAVAEGRKAGPALTTNAIALARDWEGKVISPLRTARRALRQPADGIDDSLRQGLRYKIGGVERGAERALMEALDALSPTPSGQPDNLERQLAALMERWNGAQAPAALHTLAACLR